MISINQVRFAATFLLVGVWACSAESSEATRASAAVEGANGDGVPLAVVHRDPSCGCCVEWISHLSDSGFEVRDVKTPDVAEVKQRLGVPAQLGSCHTAEVGGYVIEGHVPADVVKRLLDEQPSDVEGIAVPGMPIGSPGMEVPGRPAQAYEIIAWDASGKTWVYDRR